MSVSEYFPWTSEIVARLQVLWDQGMSTRLIGLELGCSKNCVHGKIARLKWANRPSPIVSKAKPAQIELAKALMLDGRSARSARKEAGISQYSIYQIRDAAGVKPYVQPPAPKSAPKPRAPRISAPKPVIVAPPPRPTAIMFDFTPRGCQCSWLDGDNRKSYRQCEAVAVRVEGVRGSHAYCAEHHARAYVPFRRQQPMQEVAA